MLIFPIFTVILLASAKNLSLFSNKDVLKTEKVWLCVFEKLCIQTAML